MVSALCFVLSAIALGHAIQINNGFYDFESLKWMTGALVLCGAGVGCMRLNNVRPRFWYVVVCSVMAAGIAWQLVELYTARPGLYLDAHPDFRILKALVAAEGALVLFGAGGVRRLARVWFPGVLAVHLAMGTWMTKASPDPRIDVVTVHHAAIEALLDDKDPYRISFENIYGDDARRFYNPAAIVGNRIAFGYPYPPVSLLFAIPGQVVAGDYRYAELAALLIAAALIAFARPGLAGKLAACLLLTTPRGLFVLEQGWTEPIAVMLLAATALLLGRRPVAGAWVAGLLIVAKQYLVLAGPAFLRYALGQSKRRRPVILLCAGLAAAVTTLPFVLWHPNSFMNNVVWLQTREPFRLDSLSYLSWAARDGLGQGSFWWAVGAACIAIAVGIIATPNTPAGFAASLSLYSLAVFAFGSKAFCNYYFFVIGALCCAAALSVPAPASADT